MMQREAEELFSMLLIFRIRNVIDGQLDLKDGNY